MNLFIIGDVHGCFHTFKKLVTTHWNPEKEILIQLGDLIDRGNYTPETISFARELRDTYPDQTFFLRGNHEYEILEHVHNGPNKYWLPQVGEKTLKQYEIQGADLKSDVAWFSDNLLYWENEHVFVSHAGIAENASNPFDENSMEGVIWNRTPLKNINKLQVIGHTPTEGEPYYNKEKNYWNIDTGAYMGQNLTAIRITDDGKVKEVISLQTIHNDWA